MHFLIIIIHFYTYSNILNICRHQAEISFGIGPTINQVLRLGLLGINATPKMANYVVELLREAIEYCKNNPHIDDGFGSFNPPTE